MLLLLLPLCAAILLLLQLVMLVPLAAAVHHLTPATCGVLHTNSTQQYLPSFFFYFERKYFSTPLGSTVAFVRPRLSLVTITGMRGAAGGPQPATAKPRLYPSPRYKIVKTLSRIV